MAKHNKSEFIDIRAILNDYVAKWYWFVISVIVCLGLGYLATKVFKQAYMVNASIIVSQDDKGGMSGLGSIGDLFGSKAKVDDEIFVISSHSVYRNVAKDLGIYKIHKVRKGFLNYELAYPEFPVDVIPAPGLVDTLRTAISFKINVDKDGLADIKAKAKRDVIADVKDVKLPATLNTIYGLFVVDTTAFFTPGKSLKTNIMVYGYDEAAELMAKNVDASIGSKKSNAIRLFIKTPNIDYGKAVLNDIITKYNERGIAEKNLQGEKTAKFIDDRLALISGDLSEAESDIQTYKEKKGIVDVGGEATYQTAKRSRTEQELIKAETESEVLKLAIDFVSDDNNSYSLIPMTSTNQGVQGAITAYNNLIMERMTMAQNAKQNNRALQMLDQRIDALRGNIAATLTKAYDNNQVIVRDLRAQMNSALGRLGNVPAQEREFINMKRQQEVKQQLYLFLLQRREETAMMLANATPKGLIVDEAYAQIKPVGPGRLLILFVAFVIGLCIPPVLIYIRKLLRTKFDTKAEVEDMIDVPILGEICLDKSGESLVAVSGDHSSTTELFNLLRSRLPFVLADQPGCKVVTLTSTNSGEGKSFVSINLAADMALLDKRVLLIGMDIRKPRLGDYLDIDSRFGLTQYLSSDRISIDDLIVRDPKAPTLDIITAGPVPPNPAELLNSKRLDDLMAELRQRYDYIFIDSAPVGMVSDTFTIDRLADATIYVVRADYTTRSDLRYIEEIYEQNRLHKLSIVVNGTKTRQGYGYGYGERKA